MSAVLPELSHSVTPGGRPCELWHEGLFSELRRRNGVPDDFINEGWSYLDMKEGGGKGGTLMAFVQGKYIVKELSMGDHQTLLEVTPSYFEHVIGADSLLCRILLHYVDVQSGKRFFVMKNEVGNGPLEALYDLKGCADDKTLLLQGKSVEVVHKRIWNLSLWCGRCFWSQKRHVYYQGKLQAASLELRMSEQQRAQLMKRIEYDAEWLASNQLMDYSLLLALLKESPESHKEMTLHAVSDVGDTVLLRLSIIDFLQKWNCEKQTAGMVKVLERNKASVHPRTYATRFQRHLEDRFIPDASLAMLGQDPSDDDLHADHNADRCCSGIVPVVPLKIGKDSDNSQGHSARNVGHSGNPRVVPHTGNIRKWLCWWLM